MKLQKESTPILYGYSTQKSSKFKSKTYKQYTTRILIIILTIVALLCLLFLNIKTRDVQHTPNDFKQLIATNSLNHTVNNVCSVISDDYKFDCFPRGKPDQQSCEERNCCWFPSTQNSQIPWCYYPSNYSNYKVINVTKSRSEILAFFNLTTNTNYKDDVKLLCMGISFQTAQKLHIKVINIVLFQPVAYLMFKN